MKMGFQWQGMLPWHSMAWHGAAMAQQKPSAAGHIGYGVRRNLWISITEDLQNRKNTNSIEIKIMRNIICVTPREMM
jgi:hypothetical protein